MGALGNLGKGLPLGEQAPTSCPALDPAQVEANKKTDAAAPIPLKVGLTLALIWTTNQGDVESLMQLSQLDADSIQMQASAPQPNGGHANGTRIVCRTAMLNASKYMTVFGGLAARLVADVSLFTMPMNVYNALKSNQPVELAYVDVSEVSGRQIESDHKSGTLTRVETGQVLACALSC
jgi:hypothetical protein